MQMNRHTIGSSILKKELNEAQIHVAYFGNDENVSPNDIEYYKDSYKDWSEIAESIRKSIVVLEREEQLQWSLKKLLEFTSYIREHLPVDANPELINKCESSQFILAELYDEPILSKFSLNQNI